MNNKIIIGVIVSVVVIGGGILLLSKNNQQPPQTVTKQPPVTTTTQPTQEPISSPLASQAPSGTMITEEAGAVTVTTMGFVPQTITVKPGTKVTWINKSGDVANVSSDFHPTHLVYPPLNLGSFTDKSSVSLVFDKPGTYNYHNHLNPGEKGTVIVQYVQ